jgi:hypothetical protein
MVKVGLLLAGLDAEQQYALSRGHVREYFG